MLLKKIELHSLLNLRSLTTRTLAKRIMDQAHNEKAYLILLSFKNIEFASRSFFNELNYLRKNESKKMIRLLNLDKNVKDMERLSQKNKKDSHSERELSTISIESFSFTNEPV